MVVAEIPRLAADVLRRCPEHGALDRHTAVRRIVVPRGEEPLDGKTEQHDALVLAVEVFCSEVSPGVEQCDSGMSW